MDHIDSIVIGAGVIGLAVGRALARRGDSVIVIEQDSHFGSGTSSRNSEVIHAGIYYRPGSLKASACIEGKAALYRYLSERNIAYQRCGKLIVATSDDQTADLERIKRTAELNGVMDLEWRTAAEVAALEPAVACASALYSPSTGIIDSHAYMQSLLADLEDAGGALAVNAMFVGAKAEDGFLVDIRDVKASDAAAGDYRLHCSRLVNCAGLHAAQAAACIGGLASEHVPATYMAKGNYFVLAGRSPFSRLIYPVPEPGGLGVHVTIDTGGQARFGPDVEWITDFDYHVDAARSEQFYAAIRRYYPGLADGALIPGYSGIRPKLVGPGAGDSDFVIAGVETHGVTGLVNMYGIESPGLTASLALAERVADLAHA